MLLRTENRNNRSIFGMVIIFKFDFFFKKDPRLNALGSTKKQTSGDKYYEAACKGQGISGANLKYHTYYQR